MKLKNILESVLKEVGESTAKPYDYKLVYSARDYGFPEDDDEVVYEFETDEGIKYAVKIYKAVDDQVVQYDATFGIYDNFGDVDYTSTSKNTTTGDLYRVMATVVEVVKKEIEKDLEEFKKPIKIVIKPTKEKNPEGKEIESDTRRTNLYMAYIKKQMPQDSKVYVDSDGKEIRLYIPYKKS